jgi:hypothetical protein
MQVLANGLTSAPRSTHNVRADTLVRYAIATPPTARLGVHPDTTSRSPTFEFM